MLWATSPACTELETRVLDWLGEMIGLPAAFLSTSGSGGGVIQGTASEATLVAMLAAKQRIGGSGPLVVYTSTQAHSSIIKAAMIAGIANGPEDREHVRLIEVDEQYRMKPEVLERAMREDIAAGKRPFFVCVTVGTTSSGAVDSISGIARAVRAAQLSRPPHPGPPLRGRGRGFMSMPRGRVRRASAPSSVACSMASSTLTRSPSTRTSGY